MASWSEGYVSDIEYVSGFYPEMSPMHLAWVALMNSRDCSIPLSPRRYLELGSGQGLGLAILAASNPSTEFVGVDFHPGQISKAKILAVRAGLSNLEFHECSFQEFEQRPIDAVGKFDIISMHGIYSWVSDKNRHHIGQILEKNLENGGLAYISYNCLPGWAAISPIQRLLLEHASRSSGRSDTRAINALSYCKSFSAKEFGYFKQYESVSQRLKSISEDENRYLAHEYMNENWKPFYVTDVASDMMLSKLSFLGSANLADNIEAISLLDPIPPSEFEADPLWNELMKDYISGKFFRRDVFIRGGASLSSNEFRSAVKGMRFSLLVDRSSTSLTFSGPTGPIVGDADIYTPIIDRLARGSATFEEIARGRRDSAVFQALSLLLHSRQVAAMSKTPEGRWKAARQLNEQIVRAALDGRDYKAVAAPALGSGIVIGDLDILALNAIFDGHDPTGAQMAEYAHPYLSERGAQGSADRSNLEAEFEYIAVNSLPKWRALGVI